MATAAGHMREYETIYVMNPEVTDGAAKEFMLKMKDLVDREGGKNVKVDCQGRRRLAWLRDKHQRGIYVNHTYLGQPGIVSEYERALAIDENVILRQSMMRTLDVDPETRAVEADQLEVPVVKETREFRPSRGYGDDDMYGEFDDRFDRFGDDNHDEEGI